LLLVRDGEQPPTDTGVLEDWALASAHASEVEARLAALEARAEQSTHPRPVIGEADDVLRYSGRWISLGTVEASIARLLIEHAGELVTRGMIEAVAWRGRSVRSNTADRQLHRLRAHLREIGLELHTIRGKGYVLEVPS
jgi:two-component system response regulator TctD